MPWISRIVIKTPTLKETQYFSLSLNILCVITAKNIRRFCVSLLLLSLRTNYVLCMCVSISCVFSVLCKRARLTYSTMFNRSVDEITLLFMRFIRSSSAYLSTRFKIFFIRVDFHEKMNPSRVFYEKR